MLQIRSIYILGKRFSGKTQFIEAISEIEVISDRGKSDTTDEKAPTEVSMDFGRIIIDVNHILYLFASMGKWHRSVEDTIDRSQDFDPASSVFPAGYVFMVESHRPTELDTIKKSMQHVLAVTKSTHKPCVVAANFQDQPQALSPEEIRLLLAIPADVPVLPCIATDKNSVCRVLLALFELMIDDETSEKVCNKLKQMLEGNISDF